MESDWVEKSQRVVDYIRSNSDQLTNLLSRLIRIPSVNHGILGNEKACQQFIAQQYKDLGLDVDVYSPDSVPGILDHPGYYPGKDYRERPNVIGVYQHDQATSSVMLSAHVDVVPEGNAADWFYGPFSGKVVDGKIYGRGACDDKYGIAASFFALQSIIRCGIMLNKNVYLASVADEEGGGGNGSLAACLKYPCDEYIYIDGAEQAAIAGVGGGVVSIDIAAVKPVFTADTVNQGLQQLIQALDQLRQELSRELTADPLFTDAECAKYPLRLYTMGIGSPIGASYNRGRIVLTIYSFDKKSVLQKRIQKILDLLNSGPLITIGVVAESPIWTTRYFDKTCVPHDNPVVNKYRKAYQLINGKELPIGCSVLSDYYLYNNYGGGQALMTGLSRSFFEPEGPHSINESNDLQKVTNLACSLAAFLCMA